MLETDGKRKTKTLGYLPIEMVKSLKEWEPYQRDAEQLSKYKVATVKSKGAVRESLKRALKHSGDIDFHEEGGRNQDC